MNFRKCCNRVYLGVEIAKKGWVIEEGGWANEGERVTRFGRVLVRVL